MPQIPTSTLKPVDLKDLTVAVVDDDLITVRLVADVLRASGVGAVHQASNGADALAQLSEWRPDILFLDWQMPRLDGLELTRLIRAAALKPDARIPNPKTPIVMLTGRRLAKDVELARLAGVTEFVAKPFTPASLLGRIQSVLTRPRDFVVGDDYVGPDRRRRPIDSHPGPLRRTDDLKKWAAEQDRDMARRTIGVELEALSALIVARGGVDRETVQMCHLSMRHNIHRARAVRDTAIEQASKALLRYIEAAGGAERAEAHVVRLHLEALRKLISVTAFESRRLAPTVERPRPSVAPKLVPKAANAP